VATVVGVAIVLVLIAGALERVVEPKVFTGLGVAYWWAVTTVTTVGYGDVVPEDPAGRVVAVLLMLTGLALIPTLTSVIVATLVGKRSAAQQAEAAQERRDYAAALARIEERLARIEEHVGGSA
jgi:voltage-gated potassium channel